jgi:hypothetical protein
MNNLLPPTPVAFPPTPRPWHIVPQPLNKRTVRTTYPFPPPHSVNWSDMTDNDAPAQPVPIGSEHWEEQRRTWTQNDTTLTDSEFQEVMQLHTTLIAGSDSRTDTENEA